MTRTIFIITIFITMTFLSSKNSLLKLAGFCFLVSLAILMALTRIYLGEHWASDVVGGSLLGAGAGFFASALILRQDKDNIA
jgi:undecaprenyl-diphosphatase